MPEGHAAEDPDPLDAFRQFFALQGDVLVLSLAMFAFSLGFQMTGRYLPQYLSLVGASSVDPVQAFTAATAVGLAGVAYFPVRGREFEAYR